jgi:hypothetical protein
MDSWNISVVQTLAEKHIGKHPKGVVVKAPSRLTGCHFPVKRILTVVNGLKTTECCVVWLEKKTRRESTSAFDVSFKLYHVLKYFYCCVKFPCRMICVCFFFLDVDLLLQNDIFPSHCFKLGQYVKKLTF